MPLQSTSSKAASRSLEPNSRPSGARCTTHGVQPAERRAQGNRGQGGTRPRSLTFGPTTTRPTATTSCRATSGPLRQCHAQLARGQSGSRITRIEVYVVNTQANTQMRNVLAFTDIGEHPDYLSSDFPSGPDRRPGLGINLNKAPSNFNNDIFLDMTGNPMSSDQGAGAAIASYTAPTVSPSTARASTTSVSATHAASPRPSLPTTTASASSACANPSTTRRCWPSPTSTL